MRLAADAPNMERPGADLIAYYLDPDRLPADGRWSRKHAHTQRRLCERFAAPVIGAVTCQDIEDAGTRRRSSTPRRRPGKARGWPGCSPPWSARASRAATWPTRGWPRCTGRPQAASCLAPPGHRGRGIGAVGRPGRDPRRRRHRHARPGAGRRRHGDRDELMANTAAYSGLRWGELTALTIPPGRHRGQGDHGGPQGDRGRRAPIYRGTQGPQVPQDDLPAPHPRRLPARRQARRPHRAGPRRAGRRRSTRSG